MRSRRSRQSRKLSHTQTSVPCGTLNELTLKLTVLALNCYMGQYPMLHGKLHLVHIQPAFFPLELEPRHQK